MNQVIPDFSEALKLPCGTCTALIIDVYDGDTYTIAIPWGSQMVQLKLRLDGVDCPETRTRNALEKAAGRKVTEAVRELLQQQVCAVCIDGWDKYGGRIRGKLFRPGTSENMSTYLLERGWAKEYHGGTRAWTEQELQHILDSGQD